MAAAAVIRASYVALEPACGWFCEGQAQLGRPCQGAADMRVLLTWDGTDGTGQGPVTLGLFCASCAPPLHER